MSTLYRCLSNSTIDYADKKGTFYHMSEIEYSQCINILHCMGDKIPKYRFELDIICTDQHPYLRLWDVVSQ